MRGKYNSVTAGRYFIALAGEVAINVTQLQKMLFVAYGNYLASTGEPLMDEHPRAWPYGPVFPDVRTQVPVGARIDCRLPEFERIAQDAYVTDLFKRVIKKLSKFSATQLSDWSHSPGTPWDRTVNGTRHFRWGTIIPDEYIESYFRSVNV